MGLEGVWSVTFEVACKVLGAVRHELAPVRWPQLTTLGTRIRQRAVLLCLYLLLSVNPKVGTGALCVGV